MKNKYVDEFCDNIDASVFSGDFLFTRSDLLEFEEYLYRWTKKVQEFKSMNYYDDEGTLRNPDGSRSIFDDVDE